MLKQLNNGYADYYYLLEDGTILNYNTGKIIKPDNRKMYRLKTKDGIYKKISIRQLYKAIYNKPLCCDNIQNLENEEWKEITGTDGYYLISNMGRVKSLQNYNAIILKPYSNQHGYQRVDIIQDGKRQSKLVHRLTAAAWLPMPPQMDYQLHHKDFNKENNAASNIQYLSAAEHTKIHLERSKMQDAKKQQSAEPKRDNSCESTNR